MDALTTPPIHPDQVAAQDIRYDAREWADAQRAELGWQNGPTLLLVAGDGSRHRYALTPDLAFLWLSQLAQLLRELNRQNMKKRNAA